MSGINQDLEKEIRYEGLKNVHKKMNTKDVVRIPEISKEMIHTTSPIETIETMKKIIRQDQKK